MGLIEKIKEEVSSILGKQKGNTDKLETQLHEGIDKVAAEHSDSPATKMVARPTSINSYAHETVKPAPENADEVIADAQQKAPNSDVELNEGDVRNDDGSITRADGSVLNVDGTVTPAPSDDTTATDTTATDTTSTDTAATDESKTETK